MDHGAAESSDVGSEETQAGADEASDEGDTGDLPFEPMLQWSPCPLYTGGAGLDAECALVDVPRTTRSSRSTCSITAV